MFVLVARALARVLITCTTSSVFTCSFRVRTTTTTTIYEYIFVASHTQRIHARCFVFGEELPESSLCQWFCLIHTTVQTYVWETCTSTSTRTHSHQCKLLQWLFFPSISVPTHQVYFSARFIHRGVFLTHLFFVFVCVCSFKTILSIFFHLLFASNVKFIPNENGNCGSM